MSVTFDVGQYQNDSKYGKVLGWIEACNELNVSNQSAYTILQSIGIDANEEGWVGQLTAQQVRQAAENLEENLDNVQPTSEETGIMGARIINCGTSIDRISSCRRY